MQYMTMQTAVSRPRPLKDLYLTDLLIGIIILLVLFRGFIENFIGHGTLFVDCFFIMLCVWAFYTCLTGKIRYHKYHKILNFYIAWIVLCAFMGGMQVLFGKTSLYDAVIGFRNNNVYTGLFFIAALRLDRDGVRRFLKLFINGGVFICFFAILQYVFREQLPDSLLFLNDEGNFGFYGSDVIRVTGLMGNTIIFGGFTIIICAILWAELITCKYKSAVVWLKLLIAAIANILTFSRAASVGMVAVFVLEFIVYGCTHGKAVKYLTISGVVLLFGVIVAITFFRDSVIVQRIFGLNDAWNSGSDALRFQMIRNAIALIKDNWLFGVMMGQSNTVVTDGVFWAYLMEMGIPTFIFYCILLLFLFITALKTCKSRDGLARTISIGYIGMNAYLLAVSFINSAYAARSVLVFVWLIGGMMLAVASRAESIRN